MMILGIHALSAAAKYPIMKPKLMELLRERDELTLRKQDVPAPLFSNTRTQKSGRK